MSDEGPLRLLPGGIGEHADELVAPPADHQVVGAQPLPDGGHHVGEQGVAGCMALGVIDALEPVDIDEDDRHTLAPEAVEAGDLAGHRLQPGAAPQRPGEVVDRGRGGEALDLPHQGPQPLQGGGDLGVLETGELSLTHPQGGGEQLAGQLGADRLLDGEAMPGRPAHQVDRKIARIFGTGSGGRPDQWGSARVVGRGRARTWLRYAAAQHRQTSAPGFPSRLIRFIIPQFPRVRHDCSVRSGRG